MTAAKPAGSTAPKIDVINGLRGFAALGVAYHHFVGGLPFVEGHAFAAGGALLYPLAPLACGWMGVKLFFLLSGFVLYLPYAQGKRGMAAPDDRKSFWIRRAKRLVPLFYFCSAVCLILLPIKGGVLNRAVWVFLLGSGTFIFHPRTYTPAPNWVLWSLGVELWFSVIFPWVVLLVDRIKVERTLLLALVFALVVRFIALPLGFASVPSPYHHWIAGSLPGSVDDFLWGMAAARFYAVWSHEGWGLKWRERSGVLLAGGAALIYLGCLLCVSEELGRVSPFIKPLASPLYMSGFFLFVLGAVYSRAAAVKWVFNNWFIQLTGLMCFSIYVWHGVAIDPVTEGSKTPLTLAIWLVLVYIVSFLTYRFVEFGHEKDWRKLLPQKPEPSPGL